MCDPMTLLAAAGSAIGGLLGQSKPPEPKPPAVEPVSKDTSATVRVGTRDSKQTETTTEITPLTEKRKQAKTIGGTGRSGLTI